MKRNVRNIWHHAIGVKSSLQQEQSGFSSEAERIKLEEACNYATQTEKNVSFRARGTNIIIPPNVSFDFAGIYLDTILELKEHGATVNEPELDGLITHLRL